MKKINQSTTTFLPFLSACLSVFLPQNVFNASLCLLLSIVLALLQFRVIKDSHLPYLCYSLLFFTATFCFISMPTVGLHLPVDTNEVSSSLAAAAVEQQRRRVEKRPDSIH